jgi:hypothetical protein
LQTKLFEKPDTPIPYNRRTEETKAIDIIATILDDPFVKADEFVDSD